MSRDSDELEKCKKHLSLLREEYVKLQQKYYEVEKKYNLLNAEKGVVDENSFVSRLVRTVAQLFDKELYSDLTIKLNGSSIKGHKFVLSSRSDGWDQLDHSSELDLTQVNSEVGFHLIRWVYTDTIDFSHRNEDFILDVMRTAKRYDLSSLVELCEQTLMSFVNVQNCVHFYQVADEIGVESLKNHCSELVSNHWEDFTSDDFVTMTAPLLYQMFKTKTEFPLHTAIRIKREDVLFLYLIEFDAQLVIKLNETDKSGELPLDLALKTKQEDIAKSLVSHKANVNATDSNGRTLLHRAIMRDDHFSAQFLIRHNASVDSADNLGDVSLHMCADKVSGEEMAKTVRLLLDAGADPNMQDIYGNSALHRSVMALNKAVFEVLLEQPKLSVDLRNKSHVTSFAIALEKLTLDDSFAKELVKRGASLDSINPETSDSLLHKCARNGNEEAGLFLVSSGAKINLTNNRGETALHIAAAKGLKGLVSCLLERGANCNLQTSPLGFADSFSSPEEEQVFNQTPLHLAIIGKHEAVIDVIVNRTGNGSSMKGEVGSAVMMPNLNAKNSRDQTPLSLAIQSGQHSVAQILINAGASVNIIAANGLSLLHSAIIDGDEENARFLLSHGADVNITTPDGEHCLQLAVRYQLESVVEELCAKGSDVNIVDKNGDCLLWTALQLENENIASVLVRFDCDTNFWSPAEDGLNQTLLHRALDENNERAACFLVRCGCDINATRRPPLNGNSSTTDADVDKQTPLHMASAWGLEEVVHTLMEHLVNVNAQDIEGKTALMIAIINQHQKIIQLLLECKQLDLSLRDNLGNTAFSLCIKYKNNRAALSILIKEPNAAEKFDGKGRNYLHIAVEKKDIEGVLFLLSIKVKVHSRVKDNTQKTALHLAAEAGNEMIIRNLLLADANINDLTQTKQTALHLAAEHDFSHICSVLLDNGIDFDAIDINGNNALHVACQRGNLATCKVLLTESRINAELVNLKGQNPLHLLATYGRENAAAIFDIFYESMPEYPINKVDGNGNTPLLLAYMNGNGNLCRALVKSGAILGSCNNDGVNIFNHSVATKNLLYRLLDFLPAEPPWTINETCLECGLKFGLTTRKHHCRHCGRILCARCSGKDLPILKFNLTKPVRVCEVCFDVLTLGFQT